MISSLPKDKQPSAMIEVKTHADALSPNFAVFEKYWPGTRKIQLVQTLPREKTYPDGSEIRAAAGWLAKMAV